MEINNQFYTSEQKQEYLDFLKDYRHFAWDVWIYMKRHPELLIIEENQKICNRIRELQLRYWRKCTTGWTDEQTLHFLDLMSDLQANDKDVVEYDFLPEEINLFHPDFKLTSNNRALLLFVVRMLTLDALEAKRNF